MPDIQASRGITVSQSLNVVYHSPAVLYAPHISYDLFNYLLIRFYRGDKIRLVNTTMAIGARAESVRTEVRRRPDSMQLSSIPHYGSLSDLERNTPSSGGVRGAHQNAAVKS